MTKLLDRVGLAKGGEEGVKSTVSEFVGLNKNKETGLLENRAWMSRCKS